MAFITCSFKSTNKDPVPEPIKNSFLFQVMEKRLEHFGIIVDPWLIAFISCIVDSPGNAVIWVYTLFKMFMKEGKTRIHLIHLQ